MSKKVLYAQVDTNLDNNPKIIDAGPTASNVFQFLLRVNRGHGFDGRIFTTPATRDLCAIMLLDSAHIQERDASWLSKKKQTFIPPLYTDVEVRAIMRRFICLPYDISIDDVLEAVVEAIPEGTARAAER